MRNSLICLMLVMLGSISAEAQQRYHVGEVFYGKDGKKEGVIFWINPERTGGWIVGLRDACKPAFWGPLGVDIPGLGNTDGLRGMSDFDGYGNTGKLRTFLGAGGEYAAQKVDYDNGWYLPSFGQMHRLMAVAPIIDTVLVLHGGKKMITNNRYADTTSFWISNPYKKDEAYYANFNSYYRMMIGYKDSHEWSSSAIKRKVRAIKDFKIAETSSVPGYTYQWNTGAVTPDLTVTPREGKNDYTLRVTSGQGNCTATAGTSIVVASPDVSEYADTICRGQVYNQHGFHTGRAGVYDTTVLLDGGCAVHLRLNLTIADTFNVLLADHFCKGSPYNKNNFTAYYPGTYVQRWHTQQGCDSTVVLNLTENFPVSITYHDTVCAGTSFSGYGFRVASAVRDTFCWRNSRTPEGCDSLVSLLLSVLPPSRLDLHDSVCIGQPYSGFGHFNLPLVMHDTVCTYATLSGRGCDSTIYLHLKAVDYPRKSVSASICDGGIYTGYGFHLTVAGKYDTLVPASSGCDTLLHLSLSVNPSRETDLYDFVCDGEIYTGHPLFHLPAIVRDTLCAVRLETGRGCDSLVRLHLEWLPLMEKSVDTAIRRGEFYTGYGLNVDTPGDYTVKWAASAGCDTVVRIRVAFRAEHEKQVSASICRGDHYTDYGFDETEPGEYTGVLAGADGDTLVRLTLHVYPTYVVFVQDAFCEGDRYVKNGLNVGEGGEYSVLLHSAYGCDSLVRVDLKMNPVWNTVVDTVIEEGDIFVWEDFRSEREGEYILRHESGLGCDSLTTIRLRVDRPLVVPNTFSPNGDGRNDIFMPGCRVEIFDRNGMSICRGDDGWDGSRQGSQVPADTYFYKLFYTLAGNEKVKKGFITIAR